MSRLKRDILLLGLALILAGVAVLMVAPRTLAEGSYNPLKTVTISNNDIEPMVYFDGANYNFITQFGNYTFLQPLNILRFTDFQGNEVIDKSVFILQYKSGTSWLPLLDFKRVRVTEATAYSYVLEYDVNYRDKGKNYNVSFVRLSFTAPLDPENRKPKISIEQTKTIYWGLFFKDSRWIWDIVPSNEFKYWKNATELLDITQIQDTISIGSHAKIKFTDNGSLNIRSVLDVGDYGVIGFQAGKESYWNTRGFIGLFPINETHIDPIIYTEIMELAPNVGLAPGWVDYNITLKDGVPMGAVVEIIARNVQPGLETWLGTRADGSVLERRLLLHEAEDFGYTTARFLVTVNETTGLIELYDSFVQAFYQVVGYWEGVTFTERWDEIKTDAANDAQWWEDQDLCAVTGAPDGAVHMITLYSEEAGNARDAGVRWAGSVLDRRISIHESEAGGVNVFSMPVKTNASNGNVDWYFELASDTWAYAQGYFDSTMDFQELWTQKDLTDFNQWVPWDVSGDLDEDGRVTDWVLAHDLVNSEQYLGVRGGDSVLNRYIDEHESEPVGYTGFGISAQTNATGFVSLFCELSNDYFWLNGYYFEFIPYFPPTPPTLLFGAGFNHSIPFIELYWTQSVNHTDYEIQNSTDKISWDFLAITVNNYYNDTAVSPSEYKYYRVRARRDLGGGVYDNTTFTDINLERVYFTKTGGTGGPCANVTGSWALYNFTSIAIIDGTNASVGGNWLNQTYWLDAYEYNVTEVVGAPGYDIPFNVSGLPDGLICIQLVGFMAYDGSGGHTFNVQAYNYTSSAWVIISDIPDSSSQWINGTVDCEADDFIQGGLFQGRYYHTSPGNVNHEFILDYAKLRAFSPSPCPVTPGPAVSGVTYMTYALAIILLLLGLMIGSRMRR